VRVAELEESVCGGNRSAAANWAGILETMRADLSVSAAQANVTLAQTLLKLARGSRDAGNATRRRCDARRDARSARTVRFAGAKMIP